MLRQDLFFCFLFFLKIFFCILSKSRGVGGFGGEVFDTQPEQCEDNTAGRQTYPGKRGNSDKDVLADDGWLAVTQGQDADPILFVLLEDRIEVSGAFV